MKTLKLIRGGKSAEAEAWEQVESELRRARDTIARLAQMHDSEPMLRIAKAVGEAARHVGTLS